MLRIGRIEEAVVIQITDDQGAVTSQVVLTVEAANVVVRRIVDTVKEINAATKTADVLTHRIIETAKEVQPIPPGDKDKAAKTKKE